MSEVEFTLRDANADDCAEIARLVRELARYENLEHEAVAKEADFRAQMFGAAPRAHAMLALIDERCVGLALWFYNFSTFAGRPGLYVEDVFVDPAHRGQGIGRAFFAAMARHALEIGCARMEWSVLDWNEPSIGFYRSLGAVGMEEWTVQRLSGDALHNLARRGAPLEA